MGLTFLRELNDVLVGKQLDFINKTTDDQFLTFVTDEGDGLPHTYGFAVRGTETARISAVINTTYGLGYKVAAVSMLRFDSTTRITLIMDQDERGGSERINIDVKCGDDGYAPVLRFVEPAQYPESALYIQNVRTDYEEYAAA
ncbi:MAG: hypothetical protein VX730_07175 [Pseudomonadota bacterium]|nr:hypothetical protein [Pseudomonadota bacterium]